MLAIAKTLTRRLNTALVWNFSNKNPMINSPPASIAEQRVALSDNVWRIPDESHLVRSIRHRNHERLI